jgi:YspA, cpYpsA-related SLOG family
MRSRLSTPPIVSVCGDSRFPEAAATRPSRGRSDGKRTGPATASSGYFSPPESDTAHAARPPISSFAARSKIAAARRPPLRSGRLAVQARSARRLLIAVKAAVVRGRSEKEITMTADHDDLEFSSLHTSSPTDSVLTELQLHGHRPFQDEPDPRPLPEANTIAGAVADIFDALIATLSDTRLEPDLDNLLWSTVNLFHRVVDRVQRELDDNELAQKRSQKEQDGSEIRSVELERLIAEGLTLIERRNSMELFRDQAADHFERHTGSFWRPRSGSTVNYRTMTAAMIDSRDFLAAKRRAETEVLLPAGAKIAFTGGLEFNDHRAIWDTLDKVRAKHPDMVLLHGGSPKGAERIASCWANNRKVPQIAFKPDWTRYAKAAPFKRNDQILTVLPIGVIVFPGSGISANLADKARRLGIPVWRFGGA